MAYDFKIRSTVVSNGKTAYYAKIIGIDEPEFLVAYKTKYKERYGLYNSSSNNNHKYSASNFAEKYGFWAYFIESTALVESKLNFMCLNTYDRAYFTFGFMQYAAHVPNGDFVNFLKKLLTLSLAKAYFPRLELLDGRIFYRSKTGALTQLEYDNSTQKLMEYLNPTTNDIEHQELICAARFIHWANHDVKHRDVQVDLAVNLYRENLKKYHKRLHLDNYPAKICLMICDILHHGRGNFDRIRYALDTNSFEKAYQNLCTIGDNQYYERISGLKRHIKMLEGKGILNKTYQASSGEFI